MDVVQEELNAALARYEKDAKRPLNVATLEDLRNILEPEDLARQIETSGAEFKDFRAKHARLWLTLRKFITPVVSIAHICVQPASTLPFGTATSALFGAIVYLVKACDDVTNAYDWIEQVFSELQEFSSRLEFYIQTDINAALRKKIGAILGFIIRVIGRTEKLVRGQRFRQYLRVLFLGKDPVTSKFVSELNQLFGSEQQLVLAVTYASTQKIEQTTKDLKHTLHRTDENVQSVLHVLKTTEEKASEHSQHLNEAIQHTDEHVKSVLDSLETTQEKASENTKELSNAIDQTNQQVKSVIGALKTTQDRVSQNTKELNDAIHETDQKVRSVLGALKNTQDKALKEEDENLLKQTLCHTTAYDNVEETFGANTKALLKGTGNWLLQEPLFQSWMTHSAPILWIFGGPGTGKSYLSTWIINQLLEQPKQERGGPVVYFFVKENNENLRDANIILKTLAWQIACQDLEFKLHAIKVCRERSHIMTASDTWENLFLSYYTSDDYEERKVTILIDGLDEATVDTRTAILGFMKELVSTRHHNPSAIQLAVVGRTSLRSDIDFKRLEKIHVVEISRLKNQKDIDSYIKKRLEEFWILHEMRKMKPDGRKKANKLGSMIAKKVLDGADGVFLWAKLLLDSLIKKDRTQIESVLANPPSTLDDMIRSVFEHLSNDDNLDHEVLKKMLLFTTYSRRPLFFGEIDLVTSLPARKSNYLLWKQTRGLLSSVFDMKFPTGFEPDLESEYEDEVDDKDSDFTHVNGSRAEDNSSDTDEAMEFDFSDDDESSQTDVLSGDGDGDEDDIFSPKFVRRDTISPPIDNQDDAFQEELAHHLTPEQQHTEVTFCHTRIRDYLIREGSPDARMNPILPIIPLEAGSQAEITITCLEIFHLEISLNKETRHLCDYPLCHMPFHLERVDRTKIPQNQLIKILSGLYWLFGTEKGATCLLNAPRDSDEFHAPRESDEFHSPREEAFWQLWVGSDTYLKLVQDWFKEAESVKKDTHWDESRIAWMQSAAGSLEELLRPIMKVASKGWLTKPGFDSAEYEYHGEFEASVLHGWLTWVETGKTSPEIDNYQTKGGYFFDELSVERLEHLANWAEPERNEHWHACLGWTMMEGEHLDTAIIHFRKAIELDSTAWVAYEGLARCIGAHNQWEDAISWQEKAINAVSPKIGFMAGYLWPRLSEWAYKVGDLEKARSAARKGYDAAKSILIAQSRLIIALHEQGKSKELVATLKELHSHTVDKKGYSWLVRFFVEGERVYEEIGWACRKEGKPQFVIDAIDEAFEIINQGNLEWIKIWLPYMIAYFKHTYYEMDKEAIVLWEKFLDLLSQQSHDTQEVYLSERKIATNKIAQLLFDAAVEGWNNKSEDTVANVNKLKGLAVSVSTSFQDDYEGFDIYRKDYPAMLWGRWLRDYKKADESIWRKCFRTRLLEEMNSLDDEDPTNDTGGLSSLAISLFHAGDRENAAAILAILFKHFDIQTNHEQAIESKKEVEFLHKTESAPEDAEKRTDVEALKDNLMAESSNIDNPLPIPSPSGEKTNELNLNHEEISDSYSCDGCRKTAHEAAEMYFCEVCGMVNWCDMCLALLKDPSQREKLAYHMCNPAHDFYRAWPIPNEAKYVAAHDFEHGVIVKQAWLEDLRTKWWL